MGNYKFIDGFRAPKGLDPAQAATELENVGSVFGAITPQNIVNYARNPETHIHKAFEWDDSAAAEKYRIHQATTLARAITVEFAAAQQPIRVYTLVKPETAAVPQYLPTTLVVKQPDLLEDGLRRLKIELAGALRSVDELVKLADKKQAKKLNEVRALMERAVQRL